MKQLTNIIFIIVFLLLAFSTNGYTQTDKIKKTSLLPNDIAVLTGDNVRIRTGPSLEHRIITKVNSGTKVKILEISKETMKINSMEAHWYRIQVIDKDITGWIYGGFLRKVEKNTDSGTPKEPIIKLTLIPPVLKENIPYINIGSIKSNAKIITKGDLNENGNEEIIFIEESKRESYLRGFEFDAKEIKEVYKLSLHLNDINSIRIYNYNNLPPILTVQNKVSSFIFLYENENKTFKLLKRVNTEYLAIGKFGNQKLFYTTVTRNRRRDNDGTITYFLSTTPFYIKNRRVVAEKPIKYLLPLPVKKLLTLDVDGDSVSEIISEIGGKNLGGGLVLLKIYKNDIRRTQNTGFPTYNDREFISIWGCKAKDGNPYLFIYSEEPENAYTANPFMGIIVCQFEEGKTKYSNFLPINRMLEDINNYRTIIPVIDTNGLNSQKNVYFYILDFIPDTKEYSIKRLEPQEL